MLEVYNFNSYKHLLRNLMPTTGSERGLRSKLAEALGCKLSFLSLVLAKDEANLSLEHGKGVCEFFKFSEEETNFFMLLLSKERAGSKSLEKFYQKQINNILKERAEIKSRIKQQSALSLEDQAIYYSEWYYTALHMILRNDRLAETKTISDVLGVPYEKISKALEFFEQVGIIKKSGQKYIVQEIRIHIDERSPWLNLHHRNWRQKTIHQLDKKKPDDLNYTVITSISDEVALKIKQLLLDSIQKTEPLIKEAQDKTVYNLNIDFQKIF